MSSSRPLAQAPSSASESSEGHSLLEDSSDLAFVYVTFANQVEATRIGRLAVEKRLAACANIFANHKSIYRWSVPKNSGPESEIQTNEETSAIFKTVDGKLDELAACITSEHSYDTPCIASITPDQMNSKFAAWIRAET